MSKKTILAPQASFKNQKFEVSETDIPKDLDQSSASHREALRRCEVRNKFVTLADQVAEHTFFYRNFKYNGADQLYPELRDVNMRFVTKCYPFAKGGMLLVDEPQTELQMIKMYEKQAVLKKKGFRHVVIEKDSRLEHALQQLGEL